LDFNESNCWGSLNKAQINSNKEFDSSTKWFAFKSMGNNLATWSSICGNITGESDGNGSTNDGKRANAAQISWGEFDFRAVSSSGTTIRNNEITSLASGGDCDILNVWGF